MLHLLDPDLREDWKQRTWWHLFFPQYFLRDMHSVVTFSPPVEIRFCNLYSEQTHSKQSVAAASWTQQQTLQCDIYSIQCRFMNSYSWTCNIRLFLLLTHLQIRWPFSAGSLDSLISWRANNHFHRCYFWKTTFHVLQSPATVCCPTVFVCLCLRSNPSPYA